MVYPEMELELSELCFDYGWLCMWGWGVGVGVDGQVCVCGR